MAFVHFESRLWEKREVSQQEIERKEEFVIVMFFREQEEEFLHFDRSLTAVYKKFLAPQNRRKKQKYKIDSRNSV